MIIHTNMNSMKSKNHRKCYGSTKVGSRGQIVLPIELRKKLKLEEGEILFVVENGKTIEIVKAEKIDKALSDNND